MKVLVPVKRVIDYNVKVRVKADGSGFDLANVKMSMNPFDEIAVEEAIRLKERGIVTEVIVCSIGVKQSQETLRTALAMGADRAILIEATDNVQTDIEPLVVAKLLAAVVAGEAPDLVLCGKQAIDNDMNATGQRLSALLGWAQGTFISELTIADGKAIVTREVDGGLQIIAVTLPAVLTVDLRLNEPRYASLPNIMKAKAKPLVLKTPADYDRAPAAPLTRLGSSWCMMALGWLSSGWNTSPTAIRLPYASSLTTPSTAPTKAQRRRSISSGAFAGSPGKSERSPETKKRPRGYSPGALVP